MGAPRSPLAAVARVLRLRRARGVERLQLKWLAFAGVVRARAIASRGQLLRPGQNDVRTFAPSCSSLGFTVFPLAAGVAILRYRLYDIDVVINRALVYGALTATLARHLPRARAADRARRSAARASRSPSRRSPSPRCSGPARARIQAAVDRRFYRRRYDAARTLEAFGARLRDELDLDALGADLRGVVRDTVQPAHVSLWLRSER